MFRKCSGSAVLTSMVSSHPEICKTGMHPVKIPVSGRRSSLQLTDNLASFRCSGIVRPLPLLPSTIAEVIFDFPQMAAQELDS